MKENFLHYLWNYGLFQGPLKTTEGDLIEVIKPGIRNTDSGPDFSDARVRIGDTIWAGNIEIHIQSSSWYEHGHDKDPAYNNVILHVVLNNDKPVVRPDGQQIFCLECSDLIPGQVYEKYEGLMKSRQWIPCARILKFCPEIIINSTIESQIIERLLSKAAMLENMFSAAGNDWEELFYRLLLRSFGLKTNTTPFEMLAYSLPHKIIQRHRDQPLQIEALFLGQAGFLSEDLKDSYPQQLKNEYEFLKNKYSLNHLDKSIWKFFRLRPASFPTIRLAQLSALLHSSPSLFSEVLEINDINTLRSFFNASPNHYWNTHYRFDIIAVDTRVKALSESTIDILIINAVVPILYFYGSYHKFSEFKEKALNILEQLPPEENSIIQNWKSSGIVVKNAFGSQALLNLKHEYCDKKRCLECRIGNELLK